MDFGKKGDAKKAMKLHWKKGISLKQAWKEVKSGKKSTSPKRKGSRSPKRTRAQNLAKRAMRLHHREGITLKQAWKRVNKFGDAVCPPGFEPNPNFTGADSGRRRPCLKECDMFYMRDPTTGRCRKMTMMATSDPKPISPGYEMGPKGRLRKICPPDSVRNPQGRCVKSVASRGDIPDGYEVSPKGRLRKICPVGSYRDPTTGRCRKIKTQLQPLLVDQMPVGLPTPLLFGGKHSKEYSHCGSKFGGMHRKEYSHCGSKFGGMHRKEYSHCGSKFGETAFNLPVVRTPQAPHWARGGRGVPWRQRLWFGESKCCGFGSCKTCNMKF